MSYVVPHRIETERLVLRRYVETDATSLATVVARNLDHLRRYMDWIAFEPQSVAQREEWIAKVAQQFDAGEDYTIGIFLHSGALVGGTGFHVKTDPDRLEIGYWIDAEHEGKGLVTEASAALTLVALELAGASIVDIAHAPSNVRSAAIPQALGYERQLSPGTDVVDQATTVAAQPECADDGTMVSAVMWWATREHLSREPLVSLPRPRAFDGAGGELPWPR